MSCDLVCMLHQGFKHCAVSGTKGIPRILSPWSASSTVQLGEESADSTAEGF